MNKTLFTSFSLIMLLMASNTIDALTLPWGGLPINKLHALSSKLEEEKAGLEEYNMFLGEGGAQQSSFDRAAFDFGAQLRANIISDLTKQYNAYKATPQGKFELGQMIKQQASRR